MARIEVNQEQAADTRHANHVENILRLVRLKSQNSLIVVLISLVFIAQVIIIGLIVWRASLIERRFVGCTGENVVLTSKVQR